MGVGGPGEIDGLHDHIMVPDSTDGSHTSPLSPIHAHRTTLYFNILMDNASLSDMPGYVTPTLHPFKLQMDICVLYKIKWIYIQPRSPL